MKKHQEVMEYLNNQDEILNLDLSFIYNKINKDDSFKPYNIYISDKNYIIRNTTYKPDLGFNLSFAIEDFEKSFKNNEIGICAPMFEESSKNFFSFTDSYIIKNGQKQGIVQVSYNYPQEKQQLQELRKIVDSHPNIKDLVAYIVESTGIVTEFTLKDFPSYKKTLEDVKAELKEGVRLRDKFLHENKDEHKFEKDGIPYKIIHFSSSNLILYDTKIIYSILLNELDFKHELFKLNIFVIPIILVLFITIFIVTRLRRKEMKLEEQDNFVKNSIHEIKTPLSVITFNNNLRQIELGEDEYSQEIDSALKTLKNSYEDMSFIVKDSKVNYPLEFLDLQEIVEQRINYFKTIAKAHNRNLEYKLDSECYVEISTVELTRLIDNNLSNAIKYSTVNSIIKITLKNDLLEFNNIGKPIFDTKKVFQKYFRENSIVGGYGLGLNIVSTIAKKYSIDINLVSNETDGTTFSYKFKCHKID